MPVRRITIDEVFSSVAAISDMVEQFEVCTWPYERWTHRAHLGVATVYLTRYGFDEVLDRIRLAIQKYNRTCGDPDGYHETITVLFLKRLARELESGPDLVALVNNLTLDCTMAWPLIYYSPVRLWSDEARRTWVEPDRKPLDFCTS